MTVLPGGSYSGVGPGGGALACSACRIVSARISATMRSPLAVKCAPSVCTRAVIVRNACGQIGDHDALLATPVAQRVVEGGNRTAVLVCLGEHVERGGHETCAMRLGDAPHRPIVVQQNGHSLLRSHRTSPEIFPLSEVLLEPEPELLHEVGRQG